MTEAEQRLVEVAILMAQELQEYVDVAIECAGSNSAEVCTQELLNDWEQAYAACGFFEDDHFKLPSCTFGVIEPPPLSKNITGEGGTTLWTKY